MSLVKSSRILALRLAPALGLCLWFFASLAQPVTAQGAATQWSTPRLVSQSEGVLAGGVGIVLLSDGLGRLHLVYTHQVDDFDRGAIEYSLWDGTHWSVPVDVLVDPDGASPMFFRATLDADQFIHLIWLGANRQLWHSSVQTSQAHSARDWMPPSPIGRALSGPDIVAGPDGRLWIAYADAQSPGSIKLIWSTDVGDTWEGDVAAVGNISPNRAAGSVRLALGSDGTVHMVWTEYKSPEGWPPHGVYYARSEDDGETWTAPSAIMESETYIYAEISVMAVDDQVHLVWRRSGGNGGTFHQWSHDGGRTWSAPESHSDRGGFSGLPTLAMDAEGTVHYLAGGGAYGTWDGESTKDYQDIVDPDLRSRSSISGGENAVLACSLGNEMHVVFETDFRWLWHVSRRLDMAPLPTLAIEPTVTSVVSAATTAPESDGATGTTPVLRPTPSAARFYSMPDSGVDPSMGLILGILPAIGVVAAAVLVRARSRRDRY